MFVTHWKIARALPVVLAICFAAPPTASADDVDAARLQRGADIFRESCAECHGQRGEGVQDVYSNVLAGDLTATGLAKVISRTMPEGSPEECVGEDAATVAQWMHAEFYGEAAQIRNNPPRVTFGRLTGPQLRQSLADLYAQQAGIASTVEERGLLADYFDAANFSKDSRKIQRTDPVIEFDFGKEGPGSDINPEEYGIHWKGGLLITETGQYEITIRSTCSFTCQLGDYGRMFIDNHVQSGDATEFRKSLSFTGGRVYPLQIKMRQRKRKTEQPPVRIALSWTPPGGTEQIIPQHHLLPTSVPPTFALQTWLPPDDRSYGFERGSSVDREWDESTTNAAIEFAGIAATELWPRFQRRHKEVSDENRKRLKMFLSEIVACAFRGPIDADTRALYIDRQIEGIEDDTAAIRRVLLAALKSPRFLYPSLNQQQSVSQQHASRLVLTLFDSLPSDKALMKQVGQNQLETPEQIRAAAQQMVTDYRTQFKTRELMTEWLNLGRLTDISKDDTRFPGFDARLISELRSSLYRFLDSVIWSDTSDYRQLFNTAPPLESSLAAAYYGAIEESELQEQPSPEAEAPSASETEEQNASDASEENASEPEQQSNDAADPITQPFGLLTHPFLMSGLAYRDSTSPIHRGVFLIRHVLGRTIRPPNAAFTPLSPDLHPDLTTRERVQLQTSPEGCQICHRKINGLGFVLENLDATGRYRTEEHGRTVEASGFYETRSGEEVTFAGPKALAEFLASSDDAHRAFTERAFLHFVKQPPGAWGSETLDRLTAGFRASNYNIRELLVEIAVTAAQPPGMAADIDHGISQSSGTTP